MAGEFISVVGVKVTADTSELTAGMDRAAAITQRELAKIERANKSAAKEADRFIGVIQRQVDTFGLSGTALLRYEASLKGAGDRAGPLIDRLEALKRAAAANDSIFSASGKALDKYGISAGQTSAAMRTLPAQFTDIATQLQGGANPLTILLQQGGQIKDSFGGVGPALSALGTFITPVTVGVTALALAAGGLAFAFIGAQNEADKLKQSLTLTGNFAGTTAGQFEGMARGIAASVGVTSGAAKEALQGLISTGDVGPRLLKPMAEAVALTVRVTGDAADKTIADFAKMQGGVAKWAAEHNRSLNFINAATYENVRALEEQGRTEEAQAIVIAAYTQRMQDAAAQTGFWSERANFLKRDLDNLGQAIRGVFAAGSLDDQLSKSETRLREFDERAKARSKLSIFGSAPEGRGDETRAGLKNERDVLVSTKEANEVKAALDAAAAASDKAGIAAREAHAKWLQQAKGISAVTDELAKYRKQVDAAARAGAPIPANEQAIVEAKIRSQFAAPKGPKGPSSTADDPAKAIRDNALREQERLIAAERDLAQQRQRFLDLYNSQGLISIQSYYDARKAIIEAATSATVAAYDKEIKALRDSQSLPKTTKKQQSEDEGKINDLLEKRAKALRDAGSTGIEIAVQQTAAEEAFARSVANASAEVLALQGRLAEAAAIRFDQSNASFLKSVKANQAPEVRAANPALAAQAEAAERNLAIQKAYTTAQAEYTQQATEATRITDGLAAAEARIALAERLGATTTLGALQQVGAARQAALAQMDAIVAAEEAIAKASGNQALIAQAERARLALEQLRGSADVVADRFKTIFDTAGADAFSGFIDGSKTASQAFSQFANSILRDLSRIAAQQITSGLTGQGGWLSGLVSAAVGYFQATPRGDGTGSTGDFARFDRRQASGGVWDRGVQQFARGGVFDSDAQHFALGGVVRQPTTFRFVAGGRIANGLMGEAGPEAVMPLQPSRDGRLGVRVVGASGTGAVVPVKRGSDGKLGIEAPTAAPSLGGVTRVPPAVAFGAAAPRWLARHPALLDDIDPLALRWLQQASVARLARHPAPVAPVPTTGAPLFTAAAPLRMALGGVFVPAAAGITEPNDGFRREVRLSDAPIAARPWWAQPAPSWPVANERQSSSLAALNYLPSKRRRVVQGEETQARLALPLPLPAQNFERPPAFLRPDTTQVASPGARVESQVFAVPPAPFAPAPGFTTVLPDFAAPPLARIGSSRAFGMPRDLDSARAFASGRSVGRHDLRTTTGEPAAAALAPSPRRYAQATGFHGFASALTVLRAQAAGFTPRSSESPGASMVSGAKKIPNSFAIRQSVFSTEISGNSPSRKGVRRVGALLNESAQADAAGHGRPVVGIPAIDGGEDVNVDDSTYGRLSLRPSTAPTSTRPVAPTAPSDMFGLPAVAALPRRDSTRADAAPDAIASATTFAVTYARWLGASADGLAPPRFTRPPERAPERADDSRLTAARAPIASYQWLRAVDLVGQRPQSAVGASYERLVVPRQVRSFMDGGVFAPAGFTANQHGKAAIPQAFAVRVHAAMPEALRLGGALGNEAAAFDASQPVRVAGRRSLAEHLAPEARTKQGVLAPFALPHDRRAFALAGTRVLHVAPQRWLDDLSLWRGEVAPTDVRHAWGTAPTGPVDGTRGRSSRFDASVGGDYHAIGSVERALSVARADEGACVAASCIAPYRVPTYQIGMSPKRARHETRPAVVQDVERPPAASVAFRAIQQLGPTGVGAIRKLDAVASWRSPQTLIDRLIAANTVRLPSQSSHGLGAAWQPARAASMQLSAVSHVARPSASNAAFAPQPPVREVFTPGVAAGERAAEPGAEHVVRRQRPPAAGGALVRAFAAAAVPVRYDPGRLEESVPQSMAVGEARRGATAPVSVRYETPPAFTSPIMEPARFVSAGAAFRSPLVGGRTLAPNAPLAVRLAHGVSSSPEAQRLPIGLAAAAASGATSTDRLMIHGAVGVRWPERIERARIVHGRAHQVLLEQSPGATLIRFDRAAVQHAEQILVGDLGVARNSTMPPPDWQSSAPPHREPAPQSSQFVLHQRLHKQENQRQQDVFSELVIVAAQRAVRRAEQIMVGDLGLARRFSAPTRGVSEDDDDQHRQPRMFATGAVFDRPTAFAYGSSNLGIMGEAGPEAVMPLRRGADGKLGVAAAGVGGGNTYIVVENHGAEVKTQETRKPNGDKEIRFIINAVKSEMIGDVRAGGDFASAAQGTWGLNRAAGVLRGG